MSLKTHKTYIDYIYGNAGNDFHFLVIYINVVCNKINIKLCCIELSARLDCLRYTYYGAWLLRQRNTYSSLLLLVRIS
jgi:hypothetical protein